jgi:hypothetical protein
MSCSVLLFQNTLKFLSFKTQNYFKFSRFCFQKTAKVTRQESCRVTAETAFVRAEC